MNDPTALDAALESLTTAGPDLRNGMTNHAPMVVEALCTLGRGEAALRWLDGYREQLMPWPAERERIAANAWQTAVGRPERSSDWRAFFRQELDAQAWTDVLERWTARLAPAVCAAATHGVIRVGHAARALAQAETPARRRELADALASWTSTHQVLPTVRVQSPDQVGPREAIRRVVPVPEADRRFTGTIVGSLEALADADGFGPVIDLADLDGDPGAVLSELTDTFARVYLANANDTLGTIVFVHGVTSLAAVRSLVPHLQASTQRELLRYAWQASCALYAAFGHSPAPTHEVPTPETAPDALVARAIASGDEHAIKFTETCLREHALAPSPSYLAAAAHAVAALSG